MSLKEELLQDMKTAMKAKEAGKTALSVIRMVRNSIRNTEINGKCELDDAGVAAVIAKEMKQRKESLAEFEKAGRTDLADQTKAEMAVLEKYSSSCRKSRAKPTGRSFPRPSKKSYKTSSEFIINRLTNPLIDCNI